VGDIVKTRRDARIMTLLEKAKSLPLKPGCYLMKNHQGKVIYVGKAKKLRARVTTYFQQGAKSPKTEILVSHIREFEFVLTETEAEALVLENTLIKKHAPKYNIMMRDDKSYPYIVVDFNEPYPRPQYIRRFKKRKNCEVFGPFTHGTNISEILRIITKSFKLRDCNLREFRSRKDPCLLYQIKQCSAPCVDYIDREIYEKDLKLALSFFKGKGIQGFKHLESLMEEHALKEEFEVAAQLRDHIATIEQFMNVSTQKNAEFAGKETDVDVISYHVGDTEVDLAIYVMRQGTLLGHKNFHFLKDDFVDDITEGLCNVIFSYYVESHDILPKKVVLEEGQEVLQEAFEKLEELKSVKVIRPTKTLKSLLTLATDQAKEYQRVRQLNEDSVYIGLTKLGELLGLRERPKTLECYDVAIFQGSSPTAAQIVFEEGKPDKKRYRHYNLKERPEGNNDFAMMEEVLSRRVEHGNLPDVFIVDGGKGQVSSFEKVLLEKGIEIPVCGLAKSKVTGSFKDQDIKRSEERLLIPGRINPYFLNKNKSLFKIMTQMRDEAHRFSRRLHHKGEKKKLFSSWVDQVEGVGPKTKETILKNLSISKEDLGNKSVNEVMTLLKVTRKIAQNILKVLN